MELGFAERETKGIWNEYSMRCWEGRDYACQTSLILRGLSSSAEAVDAEICKEDEVG